MKSHKNIPSFLLAGTSSGSGKTTVTLGVLAALKKRGLNVQSYKCGPDFIDPTLHAMITKRVSWNLDLRMCGGEYCKKSFSTHLQDADVAVVEGVMGLYDGGVASSASLAKQLDLPIILIIDVRAAAESVAAIVKGFELYDKDAHVAGVIFNRVGSDKHRELIEKAVRQSSDIKILGFLPRNTEFTIPDRHLGLHMGSELPLDAVQLELLAEIVENNIDLDELLKFTICIDDSEKKHSADFESIGKGITIGVARDEAFCFYYQDNFDLLRKLGCEIKFFSPIHDSKIPPDIDVLYFGGGYPELYANDLSSNISMLKSIKQFAELNGFIYGECGGFMYLAEKLATLDDENFPMVGVFPMQVRMRPRLSALGYREAILSQESFFGKKGEILYGHEFHYSEIIHTEKEIENVYKLQTGKTEGYRVGNALGGYLHLHFAKSVENLMNFCRCIKTKKM